MNTKLVAKIEDRMYVIEPDLPEIGAYLKIYEKGKDIADYLQDSAEDCIYFASEEFDVPLDAWSEER